MEPGAIFSSLSFANFLACICPLIQAALGGFTCSLGKCIWLNPYMRAPRGSGTIFGTTDFLIPSAH